MSVLPQQEEHRSRAKWRSSRRLNENGHAKRKSALNVQWPMILRRSRIRRYVTNHHTQTA
jgi:hypothetical protein